MFIVFLHFYNSSINSVFYLNWVSKDCNFLFKSPFCDDMFFTVMFKRSIYFCNYLFTWRYFIKVCYI